MNPSKPQVWLIPVSLLVAFMLDNLELPDTIAAYRPEFMLLFALFWTLHLPRQFGLILPWLLGLLLDVYYGTPLGQHALAFALAAYFVIQFNEWLRNLAAIQQAILLTPVFFIYEFTLFWIDGASGQSTDWLWRWAPAFTTPLLWPFLTTQLDRLIRPAQQD